MINFAALHYVWGTLTFLHFAIWLGVTVLIGIALPWGGTGQLRWVSLPTGLVTLPILYAIVMIALGQLFGATFTTRELWPGTALLGGTWAAAMIVKPVRLRRTSLTGGLFTILFGAALVTLALWLLPRVAEASDLDLPTQPWAVAI